MWLTGQWASPNFDITGVFVLFKLFLFLYPYDNYGAKVLWVLTIRYQNLRLNPRGRLPSSPYAVAKIFPFTKQNQPHHPKIS